MPASSGRLGELLAGGAGAGGAQGRTGGGKAVKTLAGGRVHGVIQAEAPRDPARPLPGARGRRPTRRGLRDGRLCDGRRPRQWRS